MKVRKIRIIQKSDIKSISKNTHLRRTKHKIKVRYKTIKKKAILNLQGPLWE